jgi:hypothetical protein
VEHVQIHDTGNGRLHEEERVVHCLFAEGAKHVHLWAVTNMFQVGTWIFAAPNPTVTPKMLRSVLQGIDYRWDVCSITKGSHIEP